MLFFSLPEPVTIVVFQLSAGLDTATSLLGNRYTTQR
jgi:hypothetical protein